MKKMKKILAVILSLAMVLGMSITSFAAGTAKTASITLKGAAGATVYSQQIVEADQKNDVTGWKFCTNDAAAAFATSFKTSMKSADDNAAIEELIKLGALETVPNTKAAAGQINTGDTSTATIATAYSTALTAAADTIDLTKVNASTNISNDYVVTKTATAGLHLIKADKAGFTYNPMMAYVAFDKTKTDGTVLAATVQAKGADNQIKKAIDVKKDATDNVAPDQNNSVTTGDTIGYTITAQYPFYPTDADNKTFQITDTIQNATFKQSSVKVYANGTLLTSGYTATFNNKTMTVDFTYDSTLAGQTITVKYDVTVDDISGVNAGETSKVVKNTAIANANGKYTLSETESASAQFAVKKIDKDSKAALEGAEFTLYVKAADGTETLTVATTDAQGAVTKTDVSGLKKVIAATSGTDGLAHFYGLDVDKEYYVVETKAPAGYSVNSLAHKLVYDTANTHTTTDIVGKENKEINGSTVEVTTLKTTTTVGNFTNDSFKYEDTKLSSLPSTGGMGTTLFTIAGCAIMVAVAGFFFASRKRVNK